jgi:hypothetical protein
MFLDWFYPPDLCVLYKCINKCMKKRQKQAHIAKRIAGHTAIAGKDLLAR